MADDLIIKPGVTFFFNGAVDTDDDTIDVTSEGIEPIATFDEALSHANDLTIDHGGATYVIECKVVARVSRGKIRVTKYGARK